MSSEESWLCRYPATTENGSTGGATAASTPTAPCVSCDPQSVFESCLIPPRTFKSIMEAEQGTARPRLHKANKMRFFIALLEPRDGGRLQSGWRDVALFGGPGGALGGSFGDGVLHRI